ncbi:MAG: bifunctional phosphoribosyl-AMP cyclohydrolase/phosphoribosyl-ATP diphosphatase HisIE [Pyrinomonadaceae bacterium]
MTQTLELNFEKYADGLIPAIVQDASSGAVLMLGFMNSEALAATLETGSVTFYSRSRRRLWTKGETSGNFLRVREIAADCDADTILIKAEPSGPVCHTGAATCFGDVNGEPGPLHTIRELERIIDDRHSRPSDGSYTSQLFARGINTIAQKVGEEAIELVIEAKDDDRERFVAEAADLLFHLLVLLRAKGTSLDDVLRELERRRTR